MNIFIYLEKRRNMTNKFVCHRKIRGISEGDVAGQMQKDHFPKKKFESTRV
jgi:hypothetical protein